LPETHHFPPFAPPHARCLILGSFTGKEAVPGQLYSDGSYDWYYGTRTNQFWPILESVYCVEL
jgi:G:T/U-mismatch repair DNA glycosylase